MYSKKGIIVVIALLSLFCVCAYCIGTGDAIVPTPEAKVDIWTVHVSLVDGPISWEHIVKNKWVARSYVSNLEDDEPLGGYWGIYLNGKEYDAARWHGVEQ
jgi:hypothetical protein